MRLDSAESRSDLALPRSVERKRLVVSRTWPITSSTAEAISWIHIRWPAISTKCATNSAASNNALTVKPIPALSRGSSTIRYSATTRKAALSAQKPQVGATKKSSWRMLDTECARVTTGAIPGEIGVTW